MKPFKVWGRDLIDDATMAQMEAAMSLPVAVAGALMPDAHLGYGLPIGGVLATENAIVPYAVGVDIGCRMHLTVFEQAFDIRHLMRFVEALQSETAFGKGATLTDGRPDHAILDDPTWDEFPFLASLKDVAYKQLGSSGTGNHFANIGIFTIPADGPYTDWNYRLALLTHSGSRAVGFKIATHYTKIASDAHPELEGDLKHLAWLDMDSEEGQEYWIAMNLAGRFAEANHEIIHRRIGKALDLDVAFRVQNHHNFAWREPLGDRTVFVHRKGATPARSGKTGIIPSSMAGPAYVVQGLDNPDSLNSASHGAGRQMSRTQAKKTLSVADRDSLLAINGVTLIGGGMDEAPDAYKNIDAVMAAQFDLVKVVGTFTPKVVRMAEGG